MSTGNRFLRSKEEGPLVIAHRGLSSRAPENTLAAVEAALRVPVPMVEIDVHLTADDQVVAIHDRTLQRTTTGNGAVRSYRLEELASVDAGSWFDASFADQRIPTLSQVLDLTDTTADLNVEIKSYPLHRIDPRHLAARTVECVTASQALDRVLFTSFDGRILQEVRDYESQARTGLLLGALRNLFRNPLGLVRELGATVFICSRRQFRKIFVSQAHAEGIAVFVYAVDDPGDAARLAEAGVDGIITDVADRIPRLKP